MKCPKCSCPDDMIEKPFGGGGKAKMCRCADPVCKTVFILTKDGRQVSVTPPKRKRRNEPPPVELPLQQPEPQPVPEPEQEPKKNERPIWYLFD